MQPKFDFQTWPMLGFYIAVLFITIKLCERMLPTFTTRKITHLGAGIVFLLLPLQLTWKSKVTIAAFSAFIIWQNLVPKLDHPAKKAKVEKWFHRLDIGITLFALVVNATAIYGLPFRFLAPLFIADPLAALVGSIKTKGPELNTPMQQKKKTWLGTITYFVVTFVIMYRNWVPASNWAPAFVKTWGQVICLVSALISTYTEKNSGEFDNLALGLSGWLHAINWNNVNGLRGALALIGGQALNAGVFKHLTPMLTELIKVANDS